MRKFIIIIGLLLLPAGSAAAVELTDYLAAVAPPGVVISEVLANPVGSDTGQEWFELENRGAESAEVSGYRLVRSSGTVVATLPTGSQIPPGGFLVIASSGSLLNTGDTLRLLSGELELDRLTYDGSGLEGRSWARFPSGPAWTAQPTPGSSNLLGLITALPPTPVPAAPTPTVEPSPLPSAAPSALPVASPTPGPMPFPTPALSPITPVASPSASPSPLASPALPDRAGSVWINEILANPTGSDAGQEWLELLNRTDQELDLTGFRVIRDNGSLLAMISGGLPAGGYLIISQLAGSAVNGGDTLQLLDPAGQAVDTVSYDDTGEEGWSWGRLDAESGQWTNLLTPGASNQFPPPEPAITEAPVAAPAAATVATTPSTAKAASKATTKKAAAKPKAAKITTTKKSGPLPKSGIGLLSYLVPLTAAALYCYRRWKRDAPP